MKSKIGHEERNQRHEHQRRRNQSPRRREVGGGVECGVRQDQALQEWTIPTGLVAESGAVRAHVPGGRIVGKVTLNAELTRDQREPVADTYRILFEALGTAFEAPIMLAGLQNRKIKEVIS